jgi:phospholipid transport system substrate-binding protein
MIVSNRMIASNRHIALPNTKEILACRPQDHSIDAALGRIRHVIGIIADNIPLNPEQQERAMRYQSQWLIMGNGSRTSWMVAVGIAFCLGLSVTPSSAAAVTATEAVKSTIDQVVRLLEEKELKQPNRVMERRQQLQKIIGDRFNYEEMAKRALGAHWNQLNETQRQEFVELFQQLLLRTYTGRIESYSGEQTQYLGERHEGDYAEVRTKLLARKGELPVDYRLLSNSGEWRVYDIVVDGVSMVSNYRAQFTKIIRTSSYEDLVEKMKNKSEVFKPPDSK